MSDVGANIFAERGVAPDTYVNFHDFFYMQTVHKIE